MSTLKAWLKKWAIRWLDIRVEDPALIESLKLDIASQHELILKLREDLGLFQMQVEAYQTRLKVLEQRKPLAISEAMAEQIRKAEENETRLLKIISLTQGELKTVGESLNAANVEKHAKEIEIEEISKLLLEWQQKYSQEKNRADQLAVDLEESNNCEFELRQQNVSLSQASESLEKKIEEFEARQREILEENSRLSREWQQVHDLNNKYVGEIQTLKANVERTENKIKQLYARLQPEEEPKKGNPVLSLARRLEESRRRRLLRR